MSWRERYRTSSLRWRLLAVALLALVVCYAFLQLTPRILPAAFVSLEGGVGVGLLALSVHACVLLGVIVAAVPSAGRMWTWSARLSMVILCAAIAVVTYAFVDISWSAYIGPSATIRVPESFEGTLTIEIERHVEPSLATKGRHYTYVIPESGHLRVQEGWLWLHFRYVFGVNVPAGKYYVLMERSSGRPLRNGEFECNAEWDPIYRVSCIIGAP